ANATDADGSVSYQWTQVSGPTVTLSNANSADATFVAPHVSSATEYTFKVKVTDALGASDTDIVHIVVQAPVAGYTIQSGDTWASIAQRLYGTTAVASALQTALGNPTLTTGNQLTSLPDQLTGTVTYSATQQTAPDVLQPNVPVHN